MSKDDVVQLKLENLEKAMHEIHQEHKSLSKRVWLIIIILSVIAGKSGVEMSDVISTAAASSSTAQDFREVEN